MGPILFRKSLILIKNHRIINKNIEVVKLGFLKVKTWFCDKDLSKNSKMVNKNIEVVKLEILKVKTWFCDKDLSSLDSIN